jgi:SAM-dependent methyltransferase
MTAVPHSSRAWTAVADRAGIRSGTAVLDVGCGTGGFCELAAARGAAVHGLDAKPDQIERARRRVPAGDFRVGQMEDLPWPSDTFDVVTGFNAVQYAADVDLALTEARRVARRGGRIAVCKWGRPEDNEFFVFLMALGAGGSRLPRTDPLDDAVRRARLEIVATGDVPAAMDLPDEAALETALIAAGAVQAPAAGGDRRRLLDVASPFRRPDGSYRFDNRLRYLIAAVS